jgi:hypothetical protein
VFDRASPSCPLVIAELEKPTVRSRLLKRAVWLTQSEADPRAYWQTLMPCMPRHCSPGSHIRIGQQPWPLAPQFIPPLLPPLLLLLPLPLPLPLLLDDAGQAVFHV